METISINSTIDVNALRPSTSNALPQKHDYEFSTPRRKNGSRRTQSFSQRPNTSPSPSSNSSGQSSGQHRREQSSPSPAGFSSMQEWLGVDDQKQQDERQLPHNSPGEMEEISDSSAENLTHKNVGAFADVDIDVDVFDGTFKNNDDQNVINISSGEEQNADGAHLTDDNGQVHDLNEHRKYTDMASHHYQRRQYDQAIENYFQALAIFEPKVAQMQSSHDDRNKRRGTKGRPKSKSSSSSSSSSSGADDHHPTIVAQIELAAIYNNIGTIYTKCQNENPAEASFLFDEDSDIDDQSSPHSPVIAPIKSQSQSQSLTYFQKSLGIREQIFGKKHPEILTTLNNIGSVYYCRKDYDTALQFYKKVVKRSKGGMGFNGVRERIRDRVSRSKGKKIKGGDDGGVAGTSVSKHDSISKAYSNIGSVYYKKGAYNVAKDYYSKALKIQKKEMEKDALKADSDAGALALATIYSNIGSMYVKLSENEKALFAHTKALGLRSQDRESDTMKYEDMDTASSHHYIGNIHALNSDYDLALESFQKASNIRLNILETDLDADASDRNLNIAIISSLNAIGLSHFRMKKYAQAIANYEQSIPRSEEIYGTDHLITGMTYNNLGTAHYKEQNFEPSLSFYLKALSSKEEIMNLGPLPNHPDMYSIYTNIGAVYWKLEDIQNAKIYFQKAFEVDWDRFVRDHSTSSRDFLTEVGLLQHFMNEVSGEGSNSGDSFWSTNGNNAESLVNHDREMEVTSLDDRHSASLSVGEGSQSTRSDASTPKRKNWKYVENEDAVNIQENEAVAIDGDLDREMEVTSLDDRHSSSLSVGEGSQSTRSDASTAKRKNWKYVENEDAVNIQENEAVAIDGDLNMVQVVRHIEIDIFKETNQIQNGDGLQSKEHRSNVEGQDPIVAKDGEDPHNDQHVTGLDPGTDTHLNEVGVESEAFELKTKETEHARSSLEQRDDDIINVEPTYQTDAVAKVTDNLNNTVGDKHQRTAVISKHFQTKQDESAQNRDAGDEITDHSLQMGQDNNAVVKKDETGAADALNDNINESAQAHLVSSAADANESNKEADGNLTPSDEEAFSTDSFEKDLVRTSQAHLVEVSREGDSDMTPTGQEAVATHSLEEDAVEGASAQAHFVETPEDVNERIKEDNQDLTLTDEDAIAAEAFMGEDIERSQTHLIQVSQGSDEIMQTASEVAIATGALEEDDVENDQASLLEMTERADGNMAPTGDVAVAKGVLEEEDTVETAQVRLAEVDEDFLESNKEAVEDESLVDDEAVRTDSLQGDIVGSSQAHFVVTSEDVRESNKATDEDVTLTDKVVAEEGVTPTDVITAATHALEEYAVDSAQMNAVVESVEEADGDESNKSVDEDGSSTGDVVVATDTLGEDGVESTQAHVVDVDSVQVHLIEESDGDESNKDFDEDATPAGDFVVVAKDACEEEDIDHESAKAHLVDITDNANENNKEFNEDTTAAGDAAVVSDDLEEEDGVDSRQAHLIEGDEDMTLAGDVAVASDALEVGAVDSAQAHFFETPEDSKENGKEANEGAELTVEEAVASDAFIGQDIEGSQTHLVEVSKGADEDVTPTGQETLREDAVESALTLSDDIIEDIQDALEEDVFETSEVDLVVTSYRSNESNKATEVTPINKVAGGVDSTHFNLVVEGVKETEEGVIPTDVITAATHALEEYAVDSAQMNAVVESVEEADGDESNKSVDEDGSSTGDVVVATDTLGEDGVESTQAHVVDVDSVQVHLIEESDGDESNKDFDEDATPAGDVDVIVGVTDAFEEGGIDSAQVHLIEESDGDENNKDFDEGATAAGDVVGVTDAFEEDGIDGVRVHLIEESDGDESNKDLDEDATAAGDVVAAKDDLEDEDIVDSAQVHLAGLPIGSNPIDLNAVADISTTTPFESGFPPSDKKSRRYPGPVQKESATIFRDGSSSSSDYEALVTPDANGLRMPVDSARQHSHHNTSKNHQSARSSLPRPSSGRRRLPRQTKRSEKYAHSLRRSRPISSSSRKMKVSVFDRLYGQSHLSGPDRVAKRSSIAKRTRSQRLYGYERLPSSSKRPQEFNESSVFLNSYKISSKRQTEGNQRLAVADINTLNPRASRYPASDKKNNVHQVPVRKDPFKSLSSDNKSKRYPGPIQKEPETIFLDGTNSSSDYDALVTPDTNGLPVDSIRQHSLHNNKNRQPSRHPFTHSTSTSSGRRRLQTHTKRSKKFAHSLRRSRPISSSNRNMKLSIFERLYQQSRLSGPGRAVKRSFLANKSKSQRLYGYERASSSSSKRSRGSNESSVFFKLYNISSQRQQEGKYRRLRIECTQQRLAAIRRGELVILHTEACERLKLHRERTHRSRRSLVDEFEKPKRKITKEQASLLVKRLAMHKERTEKRRAELRRAREASDFDWSNREMEWSKRKLEWTKTKPKNNKATKANRSSSRSRNVEI